MEYPHPSILLQIGIDNLYIQLSRIMSMLYIFVNGDFQEEQT
jgi:hypothetical protein